MSRLQLRPFTPSREDPESLVRRTVGRDLLLSSIDRRLHAAATTRNRCHTLVVGPRGSGKTHLLEVALHRLRDDPRQEEGLVIARVDEDVVGIVDYADLIAHVHDSLGLPRRARKARDSRDVVAVEAAITAHLQGRALVVVIENLSRVFESLGRTGQQDFRSFVETSGNVLLLASAPLLFHGVMKRTEPWFGSFAIEHLRELTLDEGGELLRRLAGENDESGTDLVTFLGGPLGHDRLASLHQLAGGSPRLWTVLAACADVHLLTDLVPAVHQLLESLVPYYQQRLWELSGNEQRLIRELGTGAPSLTVADLAERCGLEERTAASALGRLAATGWVRSEKLPGTDQRKSWYRLREPLLRHHFQYREVGGEPLRLIVDMLRAWFSPEERRLLLLRACPTSIEASYLRATFLTDPPPERSLAYITQDVGGLLRDAESWRNDPSSVGTQEAGLMVEAAVLFVTESTEAGLQMLNRRQAAPRVCDWASQVAPIADAQDPTAPVEARMGVVLDAAAAASASGPDHRVIELYAACWNGHASPERAIERLASLVDSERTDRFTLQVRHAHACWLGTNTAPRRRRIEAVEALKPLVADYEQVLGLHDLDTLGCRRTLASMLLAVGRFDDAADEFAALADGYRELGTETREWLSARHDQAMALGGGMGLKRDEAIRLLRSLADDSAEALPRDDPDTWAYRHSLAIMLGMADQVAEAARLFSELIEQSARTFGRLHPRTLRRRHNLAVLQWDSGDQEAFSAFAEVLEDHVRAAGPDDPDTLSVEDNLARKLVELARADRGDDAVRLAGTVTERLSSSLGLDHAVTRRTTEALLDTLVDLLKSGKRIPGIEGSELPIIAPLLGLAREMAAARDGSPEARTRLPLELCSLVDELRLG